MLVTDTDPVHVETLRRRFGHLENVDIRLHDFQVRSTEPDGFDTAILFDGLQRAIEPKALLANTAAGIESGGTVLIQVPADPRLFGETDRAAGHLRRFNQGDVEDLVRAAGLQLVLLEPFNRLGVVGWRLQNGLGNGGISPASARVFDLMVPLAKRLDSAGVGSGLSWLAVARVP